MNKTRKYTSTLNGAKILFASKTGEEYNPAKKHSSGIRIFKLEITKTKTRKYFVGTYTEWLNL